MLLHRKKQQKSLSPEQQGQIKPTDAVAHKKQYELLPPEKKTRLMETTTVQRHEHLTDKEKKIDADAHKKKQESLSPEEKDLFAKSHTAAQHINCKTLSPDQNTEVLKINAAAHKSNGNLSLLNNKVKLSQFMRLHTKNNMSCFPGEKSKTHGNHN
jgi:hypothetical protein